MGNAHGFAQALADNLESWREMKRKKLIWGHRAGAPCSVTLGAPCSMTWQENALEGLAVNSIKPPQMTDLLVLLGFGWLVGWVNLLALFILLVLLLWHIDSGLESRKALHINSSF